MFFLKELEVDLLTVIWRLGVKIASTCCTHRTETFTLIIIKLLNLPVILLGKSFLSFIQNIISFTPANTVEIVERIREENAPEL